MAAHVMDGQDVGAPGAPGGLTPPRGFPSVEGYEIRQQLGETAASDIYLAAHTASGALRTLAVQRTENDPAAVRRIVREVLEASRVKHQNVALVDGVGTTRDGRLYVATAHVPGTSLAELLETDGHLPARRAVQIALRAADALEAAHKHGVLHGDLTPEHIIVGPAGPDGVEPVGVAGFGMTTARTGSPTPVAPSKQARPYASPERVSGGTLDPRSDVFSLASIMLHALSGNAPPPPRASTGRGNTPAFSMAIQPGVRLAPAQVLLVARAAEPERRYPSAAVFRDTLAAAFGGTDDGRRTPDASVARVAGTTPAAAATAVVPPRAATPAAPQPAASAPAAPRPAAPRPAAPVTPPAAPAPAAARPADTVPAMLTSAADAFAPDASPASRAAAPGRLADAAVPLDPIAPTQLPAAPPAPAEPEPAALPATALLPDRWDMPPASMQPPAGLVVEPIGGMADASPAAPLAFGPPPVRVAPADPVLLASPAATTPEAAAVASIFAAPNDAPADAPAVPAPRQTVTPASVAAVAPAPAAAVDEDPFAAFAGPSSSPVVAPAATPAAFALSVPAAAPPAASSLAARLPVALPFPLPAEWSPARRRQAMIGGGGAAAAAILWALLARSPATPAPAPGVPPLAAAPTAAPAAGGLTAAVARLTESAPGAPTTVASVAGAAVKTTAPSAPAAAAAEPEVTEEPAERGDEPLPIPRVVVPDAALRGDITPTEARVSQNALSEVSSTAGAAAAALTAPAEGGAVVDAATRSQINSAMARFARALEARDVGALRQVYPNLTSTERETWTNFFRSAESIRARFTAQDFQVMPDGVDVNAVGKLTFLKRDTRLQTESAVTFRVLLTAARGGGFVMKRIH